MQRSVLIFFHMLIALMPVAWGIDAHAGKLDTLHPGHPRVLATADDFERIAELIETDELARGWHASLKEKAEAMLDEPVARYEIRDGRRLLYVSREVLHRVRTLALLDRLEPDDRYRDRVWADMQAVAQFKHWNPDHFLDVAEMALAVALAYDWMHDRWSDEQRRVMREAIIEHALEPGLAAHREGAWWTRTHINWNQVCHGGLIAAALAVADEAPRRAGRMVELGVEALKIPMQRYAPDGGYEEGPGYWGFGTIYNVIAIASLESALGTDFGLGRMPGFDKTANFPLHMTGATGDGFNFGDNKQKPASSPAFFYFAKRFDLSRNAYDAARARTGGGVFDLLWYDPGAMQTDAPLLPESVAYQSAGVATFRTDWQDPDAWFVGAKGGWLGFGHAQMDLGSFVLERNGVRWFIDLGADNYNLPGYFHSGKGSERWDYYRNRAEGHNTLVINPDKTGGQRFEANAPVACADHAARIDLSSAYPGKVTRHIAKPDADAVVITDRLKLDTPSEVWWFGHTRAEVALSSDGRSATLRQDGKAMRVELVAPEDARFTVMAAQPLATSPDPAGQNPNNGADLANKAKGSSFTKRGEVPVFGDPDPSHAVRKLAIHLAGVEQTRIEVRVEPVR